MKMKKKKTDTKEIAATEKSETKSETKTDKTTQNS